MADELAKRLRALASRVRRLEPRHRDPEKDAIAHELLRAARGIDANTKMIPAPRRRVIVRHITVNGRVVAVQQRRASFAL